MKKYVKASSDSSIRQKVRDLILKLKNPDMLEYSGYVTLGVIDGNIWAIVIGWVEDFEDGGISDYFYEDERLCGKVAYKLTNSAMIEYDYDWILPHDSEDEVWDTEIAIESDSKIDSCIDLWLDQWKEIKSKYVYDDIEESTKIHSCKNIMSASSGIRKMTQKQIKDYVRDGVAIDITNYGFSEMKDFLHSHDLDKIAVSRGTYGINGGLLQDRDTGEMYAITARNSALMMAF